MHFTQYLPRHGRPSGKNGARLAKNTEAISAAYVDFAGSYCPIGRHGLRDCLLRRRKLFAIGRHLNRQSPQTQNGFGATNLASRAMRAGNLL
jgi:hypothetical protein